MKDIIHHGQNGIKRCKNRARQSIYWPGINREIEDLVSRCSLCSTHRNKQQKEPLIEHEIPDTPWTKVASDLFTLCGHDYVIVTDYFSKFVEIERLPNKSSATVINKIKKIFSRHVIPKELCTDNGPEYSAACFKRFAKEWDFKRHVVKEGTPECRNTGMTEHRNAGMPERQGIGKKENFIKGSI